MNIPDLARSWRRRKAGEHDQPDATHCVRIRFEPDELADLSYLDQDEFSDIRDDEYDRANRDGCWGAIAEYWNEVGAEWMHADSIWGFIGDDFEGSGYDDDLKRAALEARFQSVRCWRSMCAAAP